MNCIREDNEKAADTGKMMGIRNQGSSSCLATWHLSRLNGHDEGRVGQTRVMADQWVPIHPRIMNDQLYSLRIIAEEYQC